MPNIFDDNIEDLDSSADPNLDDQVETSTSDDPPEDVGSSPATGENDEASLLSVVRDVVDQREGVDDDQAASPAEGEEGLTDDEPSEGGEGDEDDEDFSDVPFNKHPRFQKLIRQRNAFRQDAERYQNVQNFMDQHHLSSKEAADGLTIMGLMKTDPQKAWAQMKPVVQNLLIAAGEVLPSDLKDRVAKGEMSQDAALEVSRTRASRTSMEARQSFDQQRQERQSANEAVIRLQNTAQDWEQDRRLKDPNFADKYDSLMDQVYRLQRTEGVPNTPEGVKAQLNKAYKEANKRIASPPAAATPPARPATPTRPNASGQVAGGQQPAVKSTLDIIRAARQAG